MSVTLTVGSFSRIETAEERPITPAPTTAMEDMFVYTRPPSLVTQKEREKERKKERKREREKERKKVKKAWVFATLTAYLLR